MNQHPIDLLSEPIRARAQARVRAGRYIAAGVGAAVLLIVLITHSRLLSGRTRARLDHAEERAAYVLSLEERAAALQRILDQSEAFVDRYHQVAMPIDVSEMIATVCNELPESITLDELHIDASRRRRASPIHHRDTEVGSTVAPRVLTAELAGFAATDEEIAVLVDRLSALSPLENVTLDFSRTRQVRDRSARGFRLSFRIDLERPYEVGRRGAVAQVPENDDAQ